MGVETRVRELAGELTPGIVETFRHIHQHPELSFHEHKTTRYIKNELAKLGIEILDIGMETGVVGLLRGACGGPCVALRADIDGLPVQEQTDYEFKSKVDGIMHACGHDVHTASLIGAARILAAMREQVKGSVKFLFQPAEEKNDGAKLMLERGVLENPHVDVIFGMHNQPEIPAGSVGVKQGPLMAAVNSFYINIRGRGGHGGVPHRNVDPVVAAASVISSLQTVVSRNVESLKPCVISVCGLQTDNGFRCNITPDLVRMAGTCRRYDRDLIPVVEPLMRRIVEQTAAAYGFTGELIYEYDLPATVNPPSLYPVMYDAVTAVGAQPVDPTPSTGGEDFALFMEKVPGFLFWLGVGNEERGWVHPWHSPQFRADERALPIGAACYAMAVFKAGSALYKNRPAVDEIL